VTGWTCRMNPRRIVLRADERVRPDVRKTADG
jgi:hypothetical protein